MISHEYEVVALLRPESNDFRLQGIENLEKVRAQIEDWPKVIQEAKGQVLILNDWWGVGNIHRDDERQMENLPRFKNNASAAVTAQYKLIIGVGSQAELGPVHGEISENQPDNPTTRYGEAKVAARKLLFDATGTSKIRTVWLRIFSTYGPLDSSGWLIPDIINSLIKDEPKDLTYGDQDWSYLHAYDLAQAVLTIIDQDKFQGIVNVGNPKTQKIKDVALLISRILQKRNLLNFGAIPYRNDQVMELRPLCEKLTQFDWRPLVEIEDGLRNMIAWSEGTDLPLKLNNNKSVNLTLPKNH